MNALPKVSVVFITYKRIQTLETTLSSFLARTDYPRDRLELIVTDDASPAPMQKKIRAMGFDRFCLAQKRGGLGANANRGLAAADGDYVLQLQDDWECQGQTDYLKRVVGIMNQRLEVGMVILNEHPAILPVKARESFGGALLTIYDNRPDEPVQQVGEHAYTDWPHIKRRAFIDAVGPYKEGSKMWETELDYSQRVNAQRQFFVADIAGWKSFKHIGADQSFNTGPLKSRLAAWLATWALGARLLMAIRHGNAAPRQHQDRGVRGRDRYP